jgi:hypothetical protein
VADINTPSSGATTTISVSIGGVPLFLGAMVDSVSEQQVVATMEHKPIGTMTRKISQDYGGWSGRISLKPTSTVARLLVDTMEAAARTGVPAVATLSVTRTFASLEQEINTYSNVIFSQTGGSRQRGQHDTMEIAWETGDQRVSA